MAAPVRAKLQTYKDVATPLTHRRFTDATAVALLLCYVEAILIGEISSSRAPRRRAPSASTLILEVDNLLIPSTRQRYGSGFPLDLSECGHFFSSYPLCPSSSSTSVNCTVSSNHDVAVCRDEISLTTHAKLVRGQPLLRLRPFENTSSVTTRSRPYSGTSSQLGGSAKSTSGQHLRAPIWPGYPMQSTSHLISGDLFGPADLR